MTSPAAIRARFYCTARARRRDLSGGAVLSRREKRRTVRCQYRVGHAGPHSYEVAT